MIVMELQFNDRQKMLVNLEAIRIVRPMNGGSVLVFDSEHQMQFDEPYDSLVARIMARLDGESDHRT